MADELSFDLVAASLRADTTDLRAFTAALAVKLQEAVPDRVKIRRDGMFGRGEIRDIGVKLSDHLWRLQIDRGSIIATRDKEVGGIVLKHEQITLDEWVDQVSRELTELARSSESARLALERMLID
jgi:hypothetical protein